MNEKRIKEFTNEFFKYHRHQIPMHEGTARNIRGVGSVKVRWLTAAGYVYGTSYGNLSVRAINVLSRLGVLTKEQAIEAINNGTLNPIAHKREYGSPSRNYGLGTHKEVCAWAGIECKEPVKAIKPCPHCGKPLDSKGNKI